MTHPPESARVDPLDVVRAYYVALNGGDLDAVTAAYHPDCVTERIFVHHGDEEVHRGREANRRMFARLLAEFDGAHEDGRRQQLRTLAVIETGWVHAEWILRERRRADGALLEHVGYSHFLVEDGLIRRQRTVAQQAEIHPDDSRPSSHAGASRRYPARPVVGVGAVVLVGEQVLLVKRRFEPLAGQWSLPGGSLEVGETLEAGTAREILEETGLDVEVGPVVEVFDRILLDEDKRVRYHFVLVDYLCRPVGGRLAAGSDVADVALVHPEELEPYRLTPKASAIIARAVELGRSWPTPDRGGTFTTGH